MRSVLSCDHTLSPRPAPPAAPISTSTAAVSVSPAAAEDEEEEEEEEEDDAARQRREMVRVFFDSGHVMMKTMVAVKKREIL